MSKLKPVTPGELLLEEFLKPMGITRYRLAKEIGVPAQRIGEIVAGRRAITADTDLRLCRFFGLSNGYWLRAQEFLQQELAGGHRLEFAHVRSPSVIVNDLDILRAGVRPAKAHTELVVHANAVLPGAIALQRFQPVARRHPQIVQRVDPAPAPAPGALAPPGARSRPP